jgi:hypothetical protein
MDAVTYMIDSWMDKSTKKDKKLFVIIQYHNTFEMLIFDANDHQTRKSW